MGESRRRIFVNAVLKMNITTWLSLVIAVIALGTPAQSAEPRVVCYYTNWSVYRPGTARFNPQNINPYLCTHLVYAFGGFTKDNTLKPFDKYQDIEKGGYAKFTGLKTYNKKLKTLLAIGGWNEGSSRFSPMVAARDRRKEFVRNAIKFLRQNHFDGLDLDWEYPAFRDGGKPKDRENYAKLVKELREEFEKEASKTGKPRLLLTMAVPAGIEYIQKGFDVQTLNQYLDWMNLLTYDYHSAFEPAVNHHAPLYPLEEPNEYSVDNELNIDYTIKFYLDNGADRDKLVLGIPTYGRSYTLFNPDAVEIGAPADGPGEQGDATREKGYLAYYEICEALKPKTKKRNTSDEDSEEDSEEEEEEWAVMHPNPKAMGPVAYKGNQWVGYDDIDIVKKKAEYVAENGLGGIMFWSIDNDDFRGNCHGKPYPLIEAAKEAYIVKLGATDNSIVTDRPQSATRGSSRRRNRPRSSSTTTTAPSTTTRSKSSKRKSSVVTSSTPSWNVITPEPPTTPDPGSDFKCTDEGFFPHPRDCKKYFWCLDSGPSNLGIVAHQFTCPSGLFFNKAADSCDFARNVLCKKPAATTKAPTTKAPPTTTTASTTTRKPIQLSTRNSLLFRTTTTTTTPEPESEEEYEDDVPEDNIDIEAEDPKVIKELIDLIKKVGGVEQLEKHLHLGESFASTDGAITTTPASFNKKLYQKVLERTRGKNKFGGNSISEGSAQNSRRGPQNAGIEPAADKDSSDKTLRKDRPQYTTINRSRPSTTSATESQASEENEDEVEEPPQQLSRARAVEEDIYVGTSAKPLQYVNIRRARPTTLSTSDTADDTASRNALFERVEPYVTVSNSPNTLDIASSRRENVPEYVTIRRQRPTTEEATTAQYDNTQQEFETQNTALEREISSQPQYTSIVRARSTTEATIEEPSSPEPTTFLAVQISSLLNSPNSADAELETSPADEEITEAATTTTTTTTTTSSTTTSAPSSAPPRRTILRRRGSTTTTTSAPSTSTQVSSRNYTFVRRRRPLSRPNEISSDSVETDDVSRKIRSTTPDSRELDSAKNVESNQSRRTRVRVTPQNEDSVPAAASQVSRGQFRPHLTRDEVISLTPVDVVDDIVETPRFVPRENFAQRNERRFRSRTSTTVADKIEDSEVSAATVEIRRPNILPRGRSRFTISTQAPVDELSEVTEAAPFQRRPTFARFQPRPFTRSEVSSTTSDDDLTDDDQVVTTRAPIRLAFSRTRLSSTNSPLIQARKLPYPSRSSTTVQSLTNDDDLEDDVENKGDDIALSESAIEEKEHEEVNEEVPEIPKRRVVIKKLRPSTNTPESVVSTETIPIEESGKRKFRVIRRRPTSTTTTEAPELVNIASSEAPILAIPKIRRIIRKKIKPVENESVVILKSEDSLNTEAKISSTTEQVSNYGEKTRKTFLPSSSEAPTTVAVEEEENVKLQDSYELKNVGDREPNENPEDELLKPSNDQDSGKESHSLAITENEVKPTESEIILTDVTAQSDETESKTNAEVVIDADHKPLDSSENNESKPSASPVTETEEPQPETTTLTSTQSTSPASRSRLPYRPSKRLFTSTTESSISSSSRFFSRKYNPGVYTSPSSADKPDSFRPAVTRRPLFSSKVFTRRPFTTARTTKKVEDEEYSDEEILDEEPENPFVFVPPNQLFTRKPDVDDEVEDEEEYDLESGEAFDEEPLEEETPNKFTITTRKPGFKPRVVNSNTFRAASTTTELPKRPFGVNRTSIFNRFGGNKPVNDTKKRVQNVPLGYNASVAASTIPNIRSDKTETTTLVRNKDEDVQSTTTDSDFMTNADDDDYLSMTESTSTASDTSSTSEDATSTNNIESNEATTEMEVSTDDYLEYTEGTTNYPSTQDVFINTQAETERNTPFNIKTESNTEIITETLPKITSSAPQVSPIIKTQFDKLFSVSRVVEVSSKLDKHRLNKNNETTLIEEGKIMVEKKPMLDKIGEVSRFSLIKIVEDEIPLYLTKLGHVYPVENPPDNLIVIDEARNARTLSNFADAPRENLVASESINEAYRHVKNSNKELEGNKDRVEHLLGDDFLSYINEDKKNEKSTEEPDSYTPEWQFVPAAYENEKMSQHKTAKSYDIITPRSVQTKPSTLPLEALFKTETPLMARKISVDKENQPFLVYSASVPTQKEDANIVKLHVIKPESGRSIVTSAKGQEFQGAPDVNEPTIKYPVNISVIPLTPEITTETTATVTSPTDGVTMGPIIDLLTTTPITTQSTEAQATTTEILSTTETIPEDTTTHKISAHDAKRSKFAFPRRPIIKSSNFTRPTQRAPKKINATVVSNLNQKANKTTGFNPSKSRFTAPRSQNVPIDARKKPTTKTAKTFTTEAPRSTTERKLYVKPIRPAFRPAFIPRKLTTAAPQTNEESALKDRRNNFLRRTKATAPPYTTDTDTETTDNVETTTSKFTRRGVSKFKSRKEIEKARTEKPAKGENRVTEERARPTVVRSSERPTRTFVRRRPGGANSTITKSSSSTTTASSTSSASAAVTRRPFRVASRRRPAPPLPGSTTTTTEAPSTTDPTAELASEEYLQDIEDTDIIEDPTLEPRPAIPKKTVKVQRRPLVNLKDEVSDQNPSATNEDETKRQSKKYSASFKQNQLDEKLRLRAKSQEAGETTEGKATTVDAFNAETAVAIAAHQLLAAPIPSISVFEEDTKPTKKSPPPTTQEYYTNSETEPYTDSRKTVYFDEYTTPIYKAPASTQDYIATGQVFSGLTANFDAPRAPPTTSFVPKSTFSTSTFAIKDIHSSAVPTPTIINTGLSGVSPTNSFIRTRPSNSGLSSIPPPLVSSTSRFASTTQGSSTPRFVSSSEKLIPVPVEDYAFSTGGYTGVSQEPAYFTREYLLESPVTKTYDDEYQYLSPVTTPQIPQRKVVRKKLQRKISTTIRPTTPTYIPPVTTPKAPPRRGSVKAAKPFEKVKPEAKRTYKPIENYDYYDDSEEKLAENYAERAKVVLHGKGAIECLDIGSFPHPTSCKKFISCSRQETGNLIGWEYICPKGLSFDPVGGICNWSAGLGCDEKDL